MGPQPGIISDVKRNMARLAVSYWQIKPAGSALQNQPVHQRIKTFREESIEFLKQQDMEFDPHYLFETEHQG